MAGEESRAASRYIHNARRYYGIFKIDYNCEQNNKMSNTHHFDNTFKHVPLFIIYHRAVRSVRPIVS